MLIQSNNEEITDNLSDNSSTGKCGYKPNAMEEN